LSSEVVQAEGIVAVIEREPLVARDNTISKTRFTSEETRELPLDDLQSVVELGAGIYQQGDCFTANNVQTNDAVTRNCGFIVRGGRVTESATFVDGVQVTDFNNQLNTAEVSQFAVEEVDVVTGGFNAEFGNAQSGIINIVTREGGRDFSGNFRYTTDEVDIENDFGYNNLQGSFGGPIIPDRLTFFVSGEITGAEDFFPSSAGFNPAVGEFNSSGSTEELLPGNRGDETRFQGKLTAFLPFNAKLTGTYLFSRDQFQNFQPSRGATQEISTTATRTKTHDVILGYDQQLFQSAERSANVQVRGNYSWTSVHAGTPKSPEGAAILNQIFGGDCGPECDVSEDTFDDDFLNWRFDDIEFFFEDSSTASVAQALNLRADIPDPVFGQPNIFALDGFADNFNRQNERRYGIRVDLDAQLNRVHRAKVGVEHQWLNILERGPLLNNNTFADVYDVDPRILSFYGQDRLDFGDLVIDLGLRYDRFDPNVTFPTLPGIVDCSISPFVLPDGSVDPTQCRADAPTEEADTRSEVSPRIGVAHPITEDTQVRLSFGQFYQLPQMQNFFSSFITDINAAAGNNNTTFGNPNLDYVRTTAFEAGITHLLSENLVLDVVAYNRDRRGAIRLDVFQQGEIDPQVDERRIFVNGDNGNVKGFDFTVSKRFSEFWSADLAWSLQWARGTSSSPTEFATGAGFGRLFDPLNPGQLLSPPTELQPESFDRLHNINFQFSLRFPDDYREGTGLGQVLRNLQIWTVWNTQSGNPFTRRSTLGQGDPLEDFGESRMPWIHAGDIRVTKGFNLAEDLDLEGFVLIQNWLDIDNVVNVNTTTGLPNRTGFEDRLSRDPVLPNQLRLPLSGQPLPVFVEGAPPRSPGDFPVRLADVRENFRERISRQDLDGDGTITIDEARESLRQALIASGESGNVQVGTNGDSPFNYGSPREIRVGFQVRF